MKIDKISYINFYDVSFLEHKQQSNWYMSMAGNPVHWCTDYIEQQTTLTIYSPDATEMVLPAILEFDRQQPEQSIGRFCKLVMLQ